MAKGASVLIVEDNPGDVRLIQEALGKTEFVSDVAVVTDGDEALEYLRKQDSFSSVSTPDIVLLDLNLPKRHGLSVLAAMRQSKELRNTAVMVLTSSDSREETDEAYSLAASLFLTKPQNSQGFQTFATCLQNYWRDYIAPKK